LVVAVAVGVNVVERIEERVSAPQGFSPRRSRAVTEAARRSRGDMKWGSNMVGWTDLTRVYQVEKLVARRSGCEMLVVWVRVP
jgi:hypothetical protein